MKTLFAARKKPVGAFARFLCAVIVCGKAPESFFYGDPPGTSAGITKMLCQAAEHTGKDHTAKIHCNT